MKGRPSRSRRGEVNIGGAFMVALHMTRTLQEVDIMTRKIMTSTKEERDSYHGETVEDEEIEGEVVEDVEALPPTELLNKQRRTL